MELTDLIDYRILPFLSAQRATHPASFIPALAKSLFLSWPESNLNTKRNPDRNAFLRDSLLVFRIGNFLVTFSKHRLYMPTEMDIEEGRVNKKFLQEDLL
jgi:hypothetical protein